MYGSEEATLLHVAAVYMYPKILRVLLDKGANVNVQANNKTALCSSGDFYLNLSRPNTLLLDSRKEVTKPLIAHEIKLKASEAKKPRYAMEYSSCFEEEMSEYWDRCLDEVKRMKEEKIGNNVTFYDILIGKNNELTSHARKEILSKALEDDYKSKFPIYVNNLERQFKILGEPGKDGKSSSAEDVAARLLTGANKRYTSN